MTIEIANRLCEYRKKMGFSQEELAEKLGVSRQAVSKWERAEASPDTDNLIALAEIYGVTLDELLNKDPKEKSEDTASFDKGVHVESADGDKVHIDLSGVHVLSRGGKEVHVGLKGIQVASGHIIEDDDEDDEDEIFIGENIPWWGKIINAVSWPFVCVILYLFCGFFDLFGGWSHTWLVFFLVPIMPSLFSAVRKRDAANFAYPVFLTLVYLALGMYLGLWHPWWLIYLTIPVYYSVCNIFKK